jgi:hypothetical protein
MNQLFLKELLEDEPKETAEFLSKYPQAEKVRLRPLDEYPHLKKDIEIWMRSRRAEDFEKVQRFRELHGKYPAVCLYKYPFYDKPIQIYDGWHRVAAAVLDGFEIDAWIAEISPGVT